MSSRSRLRRALLVIGVSLTLVACNASGSTNTTTEAKQEVRIALGSHVAALWPVTVADGSGFLTEEGLDAELVLTNSGSNTIAAVSGGSAHFGAIPYADAMLLAEQGQPIVAIGAIVDELMTDAVISSAKAQELGIVEGMPFAERFQNVDGLRIGIAAPGSGQDKIVRYVLSGFGIDPDSDVNIVGVGNDGMLPAFIRRTVDVIVNSPPITDQALTHGGQWWFRPSQGEVPELSGMPYVAIVANRDYIEANPEATEAVLRAITRALRLMNDDETRTLEILRNYVELEDEILTSAFRGAVAGYPRSPVITEEGFRQNMDYLNALDTPLTVTFEQVTDSSFAQRAVAALGE